MKKNRLIEVVVKVIVAALTAFVTALGTTSCMGYGPFYSRAHSFRDGTGYHQLHGLRTVLAGFALVNSE